MTTKEIKQSIEHFQNMANNCTDECQKKQHLKKVKFYKRMLKRNGSS